MKKSKKLLGYILAGILALAGCGRKYSDMREEYKSRIINVPNSSQVYMKAGLDMGKDGIYYCALDGAQTDIFKLEQKGGEWKIENLTESDGNELYPNELSSEKVVFEYEGKIYTLDTETGDLEKIVVGIKKCAEPSISDDRKYLLVRDPLDLYLFNIETGKLERITYTPYPSKTERQARLSPDNNKIAYVIFEKGVPYLYVMNREKDETKQVGIGHSPAWKDSETLVYREGHNIWELNLQTGEKKLIYRSNLDLYGFGLDIGPNGEIIFWNGEKNIVVLEKKNDNSKENE